MIAKVYTATLIGLEAKIIEVEVDITRGERKISIVGLPDKAVQEAKSRIISAFRNSDITLGPGHKVINLAPADIPKIGPSYDLPMALGLCSACKELDNFDPRKKLFIGELALDGRLRSVNGVLAIVDSARRQGFEEVFVPSVNAYEASLIKDIKVFPAESFQQVADHFGKRSIQRLKPEGIKYDTVLYSSDFKHIKGQFHAKRALEIAAAGGHNLLFSGVPGSGKTYLARTFPSILPRMTFEESIEVTRIYSVAGRLKESEPFIQTRPFRSPHHTASQISLVGGGSYPKPGEISLAHRGVLFLDELPEFDPKTLEVLRQPMEDEIITIARASGTITYPANFQLIAAMNPCKCGFLGDPDKECICTENEKMRYSRRISGPIMDRIDLHVNVPKVKYRKLVSTGKIEQSEVVRRRVQSARNLQLERFEKKPSSPVSRVMGSDVVPMNNSQMPQQDIYKFISLDRATKKLLRKAVERFSLSARSYFKVLKVSRTIADLLEEDEVKKEHVAEALSFRIGE